MNISVATLPVIRKTARLRLVQSPALQLVAVLAVHTTLLRSLFKFGVLEPSQYFGQVLALAAVQDRGVLLLTTLPLLALWVERHDLRWRDMDARGRTRWLICGIAGLFAWICSTYSVNLYFDQAHAVDRVVVIVLWVAVWFHPIAILPFVSMVMVVVGQQLVPLPEGPWAWPDKRLPFDLLLCFSSFLLLRALLRGAVRPYILPVAMLCVTGAHYGHAAINKALLGPNLTWWVLHNDLGNLFVSSYVHGDWLGAAHEETITSIAGVMHTLRVPLAVFTFLIELSGFALVFRWTLTRVLLPGFIVFHAAILASSGIFFWKWMIVDALLLWYLVMLRRDATRGGDELARQRVAFFSPRIGMLALTVMLGARLCFDLIPFAWFDSKLVNRFRTYGIAESGRRYELDNRFFAPYDLLMHQSRHYSLLDGTVLVGTYGTTLDPTLVKALEDTTPDGLPELHRRFGQRWTSPEAADIYVEFIRRYVVNAQRRGRPHPLLNALAPPYHFRTTPPPDAFDFQESLRAVEIEFQETLYGDGRIVPTRRILVKRIVLTD